MRITLAASAAVVLAASTGAVHAQAITSFTGGTSFAIFYGGSTGDAVGWRFTLNQAITVDDVGVWIDADGVSATHEWGVWDSGGVLVASGTTALGGTAVAGFEYTDVADFNLFTGETYTIAAVYTATDGDSYISGASSVSSAADVNWLNSVFPSTGSLGLTFPTMDSASSSGGRFGPNFIYRPIPTPASAVILALGGVAVVRRRR